MSKLLYVAAVCAPAMLAGPAVAATYFQYTIFSTHIELLPSGLPNTPSRDFEVRETVTVTVPEQFAAGCCSTLVFAGYQSNLTFQYMSGFDEIFVTFDYTDGQARSEFSTDLPSGSLALSSYRGQRLFGSKIPIFYRSSDAVLTSAIQLELDTPPTSFFDVSRAFFPVPEPETWALMIAGFGLVGGTMRQRRRVLALM